ncbi:MAG: LamG domain-containing protein, partial [Armatimonadota bacterium]|nr:LamG domain-containing protein [Armatimonadota bacterium]
SGVRKRSEVTIEARIQPADLRQGTAAAPAAILYYGPSTGGSSRPNFLLSQVGNTLFLSLNTDSSPTTAPIRPIPICTLPDGGPHHLLVTYKTGLLLCYLDGKPAGKVEDLKGELDWGSYPFYFGAAGVTPNGETGRDVWRGTLEGVAVFTRALDETEAPAESAGYSAKIASRKVAPQVEVQARLMALSPVPLPAELAPYHSALVVYEYQVQRVVRGAYTLAKIRVAHWGLLDLHPTPVVKEMVGGVYNLTLEPFDQHPELEPEFLKDTLPPNYDLPLYFDVGS